MGLVPRAHKIVEEQEVCCDVQATHLGPTAGKVYTYKESLDKVIAVPF